ncbi:MAG: hypothetical protein K6G83_09740 [Lachnospiraceae bacterium]|nr:hypothetical protein [Lachnospiraceae bacterium]
MMKKKLSLAGIYAISVLMVSIIYFVVPFHRNPASIICYVCFLISAIAGFFITGLAFGKQDLRSRFYGYPIFRVGYLYTIAQLILLLAVSLLEFLIVIPVWITVVLCVLLAGAAGIGVITTETSRDVVIAQDDEYVAKTKQMKTFRADMGNIADICQDEKLKGRLKKLAEEFKYSDPVSSPELEPYERRILDELAVLKKEVEENNPAAEATAEKLFYMLADRNTRCKMLK